MNHAEKAALIIEYLGGEENIARFWRCVTRLRFNLNEDDLAQLDKIKAIDGIVGINIQGDQTQVIIGGDVDNYYTEVEKLLGNGDKANSEAVEKPKTKQKLSVKYIFNLMIDTISGCFTPILPAIIGAGMLKGIIAILLLLNLVSQGSETLEVLNLIADAPFYFLPFLVVVSSANKFKVNTFLALWLSGCMLYPTIVNSFEAGAMNSISFFGLPVLIVNYTSSVIPIILGTYVLSHIYKFFDKRIPGMLTMIVVPMVTLLIVAPLQLIVLGPLASYASVYLEAGIAWLFGTNGMIAGGVFGFALAPIVITGMHYAFYPSVLQSIASSGFDYFFMPVGVVSNLAQGAATLAVMLKTKNKDLKVLAASTGITALFGVTEPAMYGVTLKNKKAFYFSLIGAGCGGAYVIGTGTVGFAFATPGIAALPLFIDPANSMNLVNVLIGCVISMGIAFTLTYLFALKDEDADREEELVLDPEKA